MSALSVGTSQYPQQSYPQYSQQYSPQYPPQYPQQYSPQYPQQYPQLSSSQSSKHSGTQVISNPPIKEKSISASYYKRWYR